MTIIRRLHLFHRLNNKVFYDSFHQILDFDGSVIYDSRYETKSFGRMVDWVLDVIDEVVYEWLGIHDAKEGDACRKMMETHWLKN